MPSIKSKLAHLPDEHISNLQKITKAIIATGKADIVILFGFFAFPYKKMAGNPPYEILVITDHHTTREELSEELGGAFINSNPPVTGVIETITSVNINLEQGLFYFSDILREGIVLFDNGEFEISRIPSLSYSKRRKMAEVAFKEWNQKAKESWDCFIKADAAGNIQSCAFHLNQVVEFCYTTIEMVFSHNYYEEHNIKAQRDRIRAFDKRIHDAFPLIEEPDQKAFEELGKAYVDGQYLSKEDYSISKDIVNYWAEEARKLIAIMNRVSQEKIQRLKSIEKKMKEAKK